MRSTKKIKIVKATPYKEVSTWYKNDIGKVYEISPKVIKLNDEESYQIIENGHMTLKCVSCCDAVII